MAGLATRIQRARAKLLGTAAAEIPVPFDLPCGCGRRISGVRSQTSQQIACSDCGEIRFVLPVNVYPSTRCVRSEVVDGPISRRLMAAVREILPPGSPSADSEDSDTRRRNNGRRSGRSVKRMPSDPADPAMTEQTVDVAEQPASAGSSAAAAAQDTVSTIRLPQLKLPEVDVRRAARRTLTPFRLLMLGVILTVAITAWWSWNRSLLEQARLNWLQSMDAADTAIDAGNLFDLQQALQTAVHAAEILKRSDGEVQSVVNLLRQTEAVNHLNTADLLHELMSAHNPDGSLNRQRAALAESALQAGAYVFDCPLRVTDSLQSRVMLNMPLPAGRRGARIEVMSAPLAEAAAQLTGESILFVGRVQSCQPPGNSSEGWLIQLDPATCALMTCDLHARLAGLDPGFEESIRQQLDRQLEFISRIDLFSLWDQDRQRIQSEEQKVSL